ncbi:MAG: hypothetical protein ACO3RK_06785, partial [Luteolibacter sp.]
KALAQEHAAQSAYVEEAVIFEEKQSLAHRAYQMEDYRNKIMKAIAIKNARIRALEDEICSIEYNIAPEESKKYSLGGYYRFSGYGLRNAGAVSRAPIICEQVNQRRSELRILKQQVATLKVELDSLR